VGIVAQELWFCMREDLVHAGCPDLFVATRDYFAGRFQEDKRLPLKALTPQGKQFKGLLGLSLQGSTFSSCFTCMTCTNACPVVMNYRNPVEALGLLPHQIMHSLNIALQETTLGARMVWDCLGCYNCQEACPQGVRVTEILYELKNIAFQKKRDQEGREGQAGSRVEGRV
jgi:heterodisulfide reductase subunit C